MIRREWGGRGLGRLLCRRGGRQGETTEFTLWCVQEGVVEPKGYIGLSPSLAGPPGIGLRVQRPCSQGCNARLEIRGSCAVVGGTSFYPNAGTEAVLLPALVVDDPSSCMLYELSVQAAIFSVSSLADCILRMTTSHCIYIPCRLPRRGVGAVCSAPSLPD